jgi:hypothetical protein
MNLAGAASAAMVFFIPVLNEFAPAAKDLDRVGAASAAIVFVPGRSQIANESAPAAGVANYVGAASAAIVFIRPQPDRE